MQVCGVFNIQETRSFSAINAKTFAVNFNMELDKTTAEKAANYAIKDKDGSAVSVLRTILGEDKKSVTVVGGTSNSDKAMSATGSDYTVTVKNVKSADGKVAADATTGISKSFTVPVDITVPQIQSLQMVGNKLLKVSFTEPVVLPAAEANTWDFDLSSDGGANWLLLKDNAPIQAAIVQTGELKTFEITFNDALASGNYKLRLVQDGANFIKDFADYNVPQTIKDFTVESAAVVAQVAEIAAVSRTEVKVTFDNPVQTPASTTVYWNTSGEEGASSNTATSVAKVDDKTYKFTFSGTKVLPVGDIYVFVKGVNDSYGNPVPTKKQALTVAQDTAATATVTVKNDDLIEVVFSKSMLNDGTTASVTNKDNYVLKDSDGKAVSMNATGVTYSTAGDIYKAKLNYTDLKPGAYKISISGIKDMAGTVMTAISDLDITVVDTTGPASFVAYTNAAAGSKVTLTFPEAMKTTGDNSITVLKNYQYSTDLGVTWKALPDGTTASASADGKSVTLTFPSTVTIAGAGGTDQIKTGIIEGTKLYIVADLAGNAYTGGAITIVAESGTAPTFAATAKIAAADKLDVNYTGAVVADSTIAANDFYISLDGGTTKFNPESVQNVKTATEQKLVFTLPSDKTMSAMTDVSKVKVSTQATADIDTKTALGTKFTADPTGATVNTVTTVFAASLKSVQIIDDTSLRLTLDGLAATPGAGALDDILEVLQDGKIVAKGFNAGPTPGNLKLTATTDSELVIALGTAIDTAKDVVVRTIGQDYIIAKDKNGKAYTANTTGLTAAAQGALLPTGLTATIAAPEALANNNTIEITFNRLIDPSSIKTNWDGTADAAATVNVNVAGELTVVGYDFGKISGFVVDSAKTLTAQKIEIVNTTGVSVLKITIADIVAPATTIADLDIVANGDVKYHPASTVKSPSGMAVDTTAKPFVAKDAKPVLMSARLTEEGTGTNKFGDAVGDTITLTYSENIKLTTAAAAGGVTSTPSAITAAEIKLLDATGFTAIASTTGAFTVKLEGKTITITVTTVGDTTAIDNTTPIALKGDAGATSNVSDLGGKAASARNTGITMTND